jgi:hypothetical protein
VSDNHQKPQSEPTAIAEEMSRKLDWIIKRLAALEDLILEKPEYEGLAAPLRLTRMGLGLYEEPLKMAVQLKTAERIVEKSEVAPADIQTNLILKAKEVDVGEDFSLELEMTNAGEAPALLIKIENLIPERFRLIKEPEVYRVEGRHLNMKGKRLSPLKTLEVKLILRPLTKGAFPLNPRILYLDETGRHKSHEPEPVTITVKELGISGWIRGKG